MPQRSTKTEETASQKEVLPSSSRSCESTLVYTRKTHRESGVLDRRASGFYENFQTFQVFNRSLRVVKKFKPSKNSGGGTRKEISGFSDSSRRNLKFKLLNTSVDFVSQFCLTYHQNPPQDGRELKRQLDTFLKFVRRNYDVKYLWILEFQTRRQVPHFHIFFNCAPTQEMSMALATAWNRIAEESEQHFKFHKHSANFITWRMRSAGYLTKYLEKSNQKLVPEQFQNVGRFWGSSRGIITPSVEISSKLLGALYDAKIDPDTGEYKDPKNNIKYMYRVLRKHHEAKVRYISQKIHGKKRKFKSQITRVTSSLLMDSATVFRQVFEYQKREYYVPF